MNPEKHAHIAAIERLQPYDPDKTVVLVIHGLKDSQATWAPMINKLRGDPVIRKHYQFWFYSYPTGYPFPYSAAILRDELDAVEKRFPRMKPMVVIGHSMGGCISRLLLTDSGNKLWTTIFGRPRDRTSAADPESQRPLVLSRASCHLLNGTRFRFNLSLPFSKSFDQIEQDWN